MQSIPKELYEAAKIDGASIWAELRYVVIPMLKPFIIFTVFTATIGALQVFTEPLVFLGRSLREEGITIVAYLYRDAFMSNFFGTASATAVLLFILIMVITCVNLLLTNQIGKSKWKGAKKKDEISIIWKNHSLYHVNHRFLTCYFPILLDVCYGNKPKPSY